MHDLTMACILPLRVPCLLAALLLAGQALAQRPPRRAVESAVDFATGQDDNLFSVLRSQDLIHLFEQGTAEIAAGEHRTGVEKLHQLLQADSGGVVPVAPGRFLGLRLATVLALANLSPAAAVAYEDLVRRETGTLPAFDALDDEQLERLATLFPAAAIGRRARLRLGDRALTAGEALAAAAHFRQALDAAAIGSTEERRIAERWHCAMVLLDPAAARADGKHAALPPPCGDVLGVLPPSGDATSWPAYGGAAAGRTPMAAPLGQPDARWSEEVVAPGFGQGGREIGLYPMHAVGDLDGVFVNTGHEVVAFDPLRRGIAWVSHAPMRLVAEASEPMRRRDRDSWNGINQDMVLAAACSDDVVVAALQVPEKSMNVDFQGAYRVMSKIPMRRLHAFSRHGGKLLWAHYDDLDGPRTRRFQGHDACAPPVIVGDTVYVPTHDRSGAVAFAIAAYELHTGNLKWRRLVCSSQQDVNMFGNARAEFAASPIALHGGVVYGSSNLGVAYALEAATGRIRWIASYGVVRMPRAMMHHQQDRQVYFANNCPAIVDDVVCLTPTDSQFVLGLDTESGRTLWRLPAEATVDGVDNRVVWLAGALGTEFVLSGVGAVAVAARPTASLQDAASVRQLVPPEELGDRRNSQLPPRPAVTAEAVWFARPDAVLAFDRHGRPLPGTPLRLGRFLPGNLLLVSGIVVSLRQHVLEAAWNGEALRARVEELARSRPEDPATLLRLGNLRQSLLPAAPDAAALRGVHDTYRQGLAAAMRRGLPVDDPVRQALQGELFRQALQIAEAAVLRDDPAVVRLLTEARDVAPDTEQWLEVQAIVMARLADDDLFAAELDRLLAHAPEATFPADGGVPVRAWVGWQRARRATSPASAVAAWQDLLERHGEVVLGDRPAATAAREAIEALLARHGPEVYAPVQARAEQALRDAGSDRLALASVVRRFPNSDVGATARTALLDAAVREGDLAVVCRMLAELLPTDDVPPGVARRVMVAATSAGNASLAAAMARLLRAHQAATSDWPDDGKATFGALLAALPPVPSPMPLPLALPTADKARLVPRAAREVFGLATVHPAAGFALPSDVPLFVRSGNELLAIDVHAASADKPVLFAVPFDYLEHLVLCGTTLVVPDMERVHAVDYRTGVSRWVLPNPQRRLLESLGVQDGVLHVTSIPNTPEGSTECAGVEPLSGALLWTWRGTLKPKATSAGLLQLELTGEGRAAVHVIDPVLGSVRTTTPVPAAEFAASQPLEPDSLATRLYPQYLATDGERLLMPIDNAQPAGKPRLLAVAADGRIAWQWQGATGAQLAMAAHADGRCVLVEAHASRVSRVVLLRAADGATLRDVEVGHEPTVLNWDRGSLANPAPPLLVLQSFATADRADRQLVCVDTRDGGSAFVVPLGAGDGDVVSTPQFGEDFLAFATRAGKGTRENRLHVVSLRDRSGMLPDGRRHRGLPMPGSIDSMARLGSQLVVAGAQTVLLLGTEGESR